MGETIGHESQAAGHHERDDQRAAHAPFEAARERLTHTPAHQRHEDTQHQHHVETRHPAPIIEPGFPDRPTQRADEYQRIQPDTDPHAGHDQRAGDEHADPGDQVVPRAAQAGQIAARARQCDAGEQYQPANDE